MKKDTSPPNRQTGFWLNLVWVTLPLLIVTLSLEFDANKNKYSPNVYRYSAIGPKTIVKRLSM